MAIAKIKDKSIGCLLVLGLAASLTVGATVAGATLMINRGLIIDLEESIKAQHAYNKSDYDKMIKTALEMVQVTDMYSQDFERIYEKLISERYAGEEKQNLDKLFKVVNESNPNLDSSVYSNLQTEIASNRKIFSNNQGKLTDMIGEYNKVVRKKFITSAIFNKETMDANDFIVTSDRTDKAFESGKDEAIELRGNN